MNMKIFIFAQVVLLFQATSAQSPSPAPPPAAPSLCETITHFVPEAQMVTFAENVCASLDSDSVPTSCDKKDGPIVKLLELMFPTDCLCDTGLRNEMIEKIAGNMEKYLACAQNYEVNCFPPNIFTLTEKPLPFVGKFHKSDYDAKKAVMEECVNVPVTDDNAGTKIYDGIVAALPYANTCGEHVTPPAELKTVIDALVVTIDQDDDTSDDGLENATNKLFNYMALPATGQTPVSALNAMKGICAFGFQSEDVNSAQKNATHMFENLFGFANTPLAMTGDIFKSAWSESSD
jgi:hypothetical protein